jgi:hypothetical protein
MPDRCGAAGKIIMYSPALSRGAVTQELARLVFLGPYKISIDCLFAECLARFEAMQTVDESQTITIAPNEDGCLLSDF